MGDIEGIIGRGTVTMKPCASQRDGAGAALELDSAIRLPHPWSSMLKLHLSPANRWRVIRVGKPVGESVNDR